jgi:hypothetical protein
MIQRVAIQNWSDDIAGWKVGATAYDIQKLFGLNEWSTARCLRGVFLPARLDSKLRISVT